MANILHFTHGKNLAQILTAGGLWSNRHRPASLAAPQSIAHSAIQDRRAAWPVPKGPGGVLHDYVPFYFGERSPMLYANHTGQVPSNPDGQRALLYLVSSTNLVSTNQLPYVFTDGHAIMGPTRFFDDLRDLSLLDWPTIHSRLWNDTLEDPDRKRRKQAEFLVHRFLPWKLIQRIVVLDAVIRERVLILLRTATHQPPVDVEPLWYY